MSGPKVVDVRAVRAIQERAWKVLCHRLEKELLELKKLCGSDENEADQRALVVFEASLTRLKAEPQMRPLPQLLDSVLDQANAQMSLASELRSSLEQARLDKLAVEQAKSRSRHLAVSSLANRLEAINHFELRDQLLNAPTDESINHVLDVLESQKLHQSPSDLQSMVNSITGSPTSVTVDQWLTTHGRRDDPILTRLDELAARIELISGIENASSWREKIMAVAQIPDDARRRLQADSIAIQLADERKRLQRLRDRMRQLDELESLLAAFETSGAHLLQQIENARIDTSLGLEGLKSDVESWCAEEGKRRDQAICQHAILSVLRSMGYDVRESMFTAWAQHGHVIVQDSSRQDYGVELCTLPGGRLRTQLVRFGNQNETSEKQRQRDTEVEHQWCKSHIKVLEALDEQGLAPEVLAARTAGSTPVKVIETQSNNRADSANSDSKQLRQRWRP
jgi:hypothetical protein